LFLFFFSLNLKKICFIKTMGKQIILYVILVGVLVALYMLVRHCGNKRGRQGKVGMGPVNPNVQLDHKNPCDYLAMNGYTPATVQACDVSNTICGTPSAVDWVVSFSELYDPFDPRAEQMMKSYAADVSQHHEHCVPPGLCSTNVDCQPRGTDFGLTCKNIKCVPDDCKPEEECTPKMICTGSCL